MGFTGTSREANHLCVLVHGLWGNPNHLAQLAAALRKKYPEEDLHILVPKRNSGSFTYDGIELGGERVCHEIEEEIEKLSHAGQEIKKISFCGYSLGGLVARYAVGLLYSKSFFDKIQPVNFTTFATPHLGVRTPLRGWHNHIWNVLGARTLSTSGRQLFTIDSFRDTGKPLLEILADPESIFIKGLAKFERRILYANVVNDRSAPYFTTGITSWDPYVNVEKVKIKYVRGYEDVVLDPEAPVIPLESTEAHLTILERFLQGCQAMIGRLPFLIAMAFFIPFGVLAFLINSGVQSLYSNRRIRLHERGLAGIQPSRYRVPLLITEMRGAVEDAYENLNSAQSQKYLVTSTEDEAVQDEPRDAAYSRRSSVSVDRSEAPTLALAPYQFRMIQALNGVGWRKYPVYIHKVSHSHAAIIVRIAKPRYDEGYVIMRHWLDNEFIL